MNIKILIAIHRRYWVPLEEMYVPIFVGKATSKEKLEYAGDDSGDNISSLNGKYSELTGVYWAWKNLDADAIGMVHYRRYLAEPGTHNRVSRQKREEWILKKDTVERFLRRVDVIVPRKRKYFIETIYSHYDHTHDGKHLRLAEKIIKRRCPEYLESYKNVLGRTSAHMFNMFVMKREQFCAYCAWLFPILDELDQLVDDAGMSEFERRYLGRVGELLLDVWLDQNHISYVEVPYVQLGKAHWFRKARSFFAAKFWHKKYEQSI